MAVPLGAPQRLVVVIDTALLGDFLDHLETDRGNDARTRNARLATIRSFFRFVALHAVELASMTRTGDHGTAANRTGNRAFGFAEAPWSDTLRPRDSAPEFVGGASADSE